MPKPFRNLPNPFWGLPRPLPRLPWLQPACRSKILHALGVLAVDGSSNSGKECHIMRGRLFGGDARRIGRRDIPLAISLRTVQRDIDRGGKLLGILSKKPWFRAVMERRGYDAIVHKRGWGMYLFLIGYLADTDTAKPVEAKPATPQEIAISHLNLWDGPNFEVAKAALEHLHPGQAVYVFKNLKAEDGPKSVGAVDTFLKRIEALRSGSDPERAGTRAEDVAAVATLEKRGILSKEIEAELKKHIETAGTLAPLPAEPIDEPDEIEDPEYLKVAEEFHRWLHDWRTTARRAFPRRDHQIQLGLTSRRKKVAVDEDEENDE